MAADPITAHTVDVLLNEDEFDSDDPFGDKPLKQVQRDDKPTLSPRKRKVDDLFGNLDEEVKIAKPRKKIPKLDAERLLSEPGLPKVRTLIRSGKLTEKLRLRGKGHEFNDVAKMLNYYQMWLDQLYPRAKFADAIQMVEKAGHTKKLQMYRRTWIDEGKPGYMSRQAADKAMEDEARLGNADEAQNEEAVDRPPLAEDEDPNSLFFGHGDHDETNDNGPDDDELEALMAQESAAPLRQQQLNYTAEESEGEDDLDALLREQDVTRQKRTQMMDEQDELDVMLEADLTTSVQSAISGAKETPRDSEDEVHSISDQLPSSTLKATTNAPSTEDFDAIFDDNDNELDSLEQDAQPSEPTLPPNSTFSRFPPSTSNGNIYHPNSEEVPELDTAISSSPIPNIQTDELDDLMDEHDALVKQKQAEAGILHNSAANST